MQPNNGSWRLTPAALTVDEISDLRELTPDGIRELSRQLRKQQHDLKDFSDSLEQEFLDLGGLLRCISQISRQVQMESHKAIEASLGEGQSSPVDFAFQLLKKAEDLVLTNREQHIKVVKVLETVGAELKHVARERDGLLWTLAPLKMIKTQFRVQACHFDEITRAQFFTLADTTGDLVNSFQKVVGQRFEELDVTARTASEVIERLNQSIELQRQSTDEYLHTARKHLASLGESLRKSQGFAETVSQAGMNITGGVTKAIIALQAQDATRQKIEHISAAVNEIVVHLERGIVRRLTPEEEADCRQFLSDASRVQLAQLRAAFQQLTTAAREVSSGLRDVATETQSVADKALQSGGVALGGRVFGERLESLHGVFNMIARAIEDLQDVAGLIHKLKSTFSDCTSEMVRLGHELRVVAVNSQIFAARVEGGMALKAITKDTRQLTDTAMSRLDEISPRVDSLVEAVIDLEERLRDYAEISGDERKTLSQEAVESEAGLRAMRQELLQAVEGIQPLERELVRTVELAEQRIHFPEVVKQISSQSSALFEKMTGSPADTGPVGSQAPHARLRELEQNYTMASERAIHQNLLGENTGSEIADSSPSEANGGNDEEFAGDIELF